MSWAGRSEAVEYGITQGFGMRRGRGSGMGMTESLQRGDLWGGLFWD